MSSHGLHDTMRLYITPQTYILKPASPMGTNLQSPTSRPGLVFDRRNGKLSIESESEAARMPSRDIHAFSNVHEQSLRIYGLLGTIRLVQNEYLIVIKGRASLGIINGHRIFMATDFGVLPIEYSASHKQSSTEQELIALVQAHLSSGKFYFSYTSDLTTSLQRQQKSDRPLYEQTESQFFWNAYLQHRMIDFAQSPESASVASEISKFILPVIYGFVSINETRLNGTSLQFSLISRRSRHRAGTRYFTRGLDVNGNVANFNETEQIVSITSGPKKGHMFSFVQCRGSAPMFWAEINTLHYRPDLQIMNSFGDVQEALATHIKSLSQTYGRVLIVNLVNQTGYEKIVKDAMEKALTTLNHPQVKYEYFDFHAECSKMRWQRLSLLINKIQGDLESSHWFQIDPQGQTVSSQTSIIRSNCMDCLDRTNVVQAAVAKWVLNKQLHSIGILPIERDIDGDMDFLQVFRCVWADHADAVSIAYSGTGALKTDFTRTGQRSHQGAVSDVMNSAVRYIKNNYLDGPRQDSFDIMTGQWKAKPTMDRLFDDSRPIWLRALPYLLFGSILMLLFGSTIAPGRIDSLSLGFWFVLSVILVSLILNFGVEFVAWPTLLPPTAVLNYKGPGARTATHGRGVFMKQIVTKVSRIANRAQAGTRSRLDIEVGEKKHED